MSLAGSFPGAYGTSTTCSRLTENQIINLYINQDPSKSPTCNNRSRFHYFWSELGLILSILELNPDKETDNTATGPAAILIVRNAFGRYVWSMQMRQGPITDASHLNETDLSRPKSWGCFLERLLKTSVTNKSAQSLQFPPSIADIPLVKA